jgi:hypothetical protein
MIRETKAALAMLLIAAALAGVYELHISAAAAEREPLYYQDPTGKPDYSPTPKKDAAGRDYVPVYDDTAAAPASAPSPSSAIAPGGDRKILYYRNPMGLPDTSPVPKKDSLTSPTGMVRAAVSASASTTGVLRLWILRGSAA